MVVGLDTIAVFEDRREPGDWRVEYFDDDGGCFVTVFAGPEAERRARDYAAQGWRAQAGNSGRQRLNRRAVGRAALSLSNDRRHVATSPDSDFTLNIEEAV